MDQRALFHWHLGGGSCRPAIGDLRRGRKELVEDDCRRRLINDLTRVSKQGVRKTTLTPFKAVCVKVVAIGRMENLVG